MSAEVVLERTGATLEGSRVAIEGFGKVGSALARLLRLRGANVVAVSTSRGALYSEHGLDVERLVRRSRDLGSRFVEHEPHVIGRSALLELPVDLLCPCARHHSIHAENAARISARAICAGANNPATVAAERDLVARGVVFPPDFLTNCGGVLGGTLEFAGVPLHRIATLIAENLRPCLADLLDRAEQLATPPRSLAEADALERHARVRGRVENGRLTQRLHSLALEAYRRGLIPKQPVSLVASRSVARWMA